MTPPFVRNPYNYDMNLAGDESALECKDPTLAQQQFAEESDINFIANKFHLTGEVPTVLNLPKYGDFEGIFDFQSAQNSVRIALEQFMTLPAKLRTRFDNKPQKLLDFLENPENKEEAEFLGLTNKPQDPPQAPPAGPAAQGEAKTPPQDPTPPQTP